MKQIASGRVGMAVAKYGENAPMATVCCNSCRTCVTTNVIAVVGTTFAAAAGGISRVVRRKPA